MSNSNDQGKCTIRCWVIAIAAGVVLVLVLMGPAGWDFWGALVVALVVFGIAGIMLPRLFCAAAGQATSSPAPRPSTDAAAPPAAPTPEPVAAPSAESAPAPEPAPAPESEAVTADDAAADAQTAPAPEPQATETSGFLIRSAQLPGQQELDARRGNWRYEPVAAESRVESTVVESAPAAPETTPDTAAEDAGPDDLKLIRGIGPVLERKLNAVGVSTFAQIAAWDEADVARMDELLSFRGRITREDWIGQARILASGGATEFSARKG